MAGSMLTLRKKKGSTVPVIAAFITTITRASAMANPSFEPMDKKPTKEKKCGIALSVVVFLVFQNGILLSSFLKLQYSLKKNL